MDFLKKNNPNEAQQPPKENLNIPPTDKVIAMRNQGLSNNEIIQNLQRFGYESNIILDGMNQADVKHRIENFPPSGDNPDAINNKIQMNPQNTHGGPIPTEQNGESTGAPVPAQNPNELPPMPPLGNMSPPDMPDLNKQDSGAIEQIGIERIEEIAEAIIDEKWNEIVRSINKIIDWKERTESNMIKLEQKFEDLRKDFEGLNQGILGKIGEYDKNLGDLGVEIKAMERVFQNIIPTLTENVHTLEKITGKMKDNQ